MLELILEIIGWGVLAIAVYVAIERMKK